MVVGAKMIAVFGSFSALTSFGNVNAVHPFYDNPKNRFFIFFFLSNHIVMRIKQMLEMCN